MNWTRYGRSCCDLRSRQTCCTRIFSQGVRKKWKVQFRMFGVAAGICYRIYKLWVRACVCVNCVHIRSCFVHLCQLCAWMQTVFMPARSCVSPFAIFFHYRLQFLWNIPVQLPPANETPDGKVNKAAGSSVYSIIVYALALKFTCQRLWHADRLDFKVLSMKIKIHCLVFPHIGRRAILSLLYF